MWNKGSSYWEAQEGRKGHGGEGRQRLLHISKGELLEGFDRDARHWGEIIAIHYGKGPAKAIVRKAREEYGALITDIPYIGGDENHLTRSLIQSAEYLALYRAMKARGKTADETGKVLYDAVKLRGPTHPVPPSKRLTTEGLMKRRRARAERSQKRLFPGDWVYRFVEGDGVEFDYGYDFLECGTQKFYLTQDADEFLPFYCFLDFPSSRADGLGLTRTMTLAEGHKKCNHRFKKGRKTEQEWPPPFLSRGKRGLLKGHAHA